MPNVGFLSITIKEQVYDRMHTIYLKNNFNLMKEGINSFVGYITNRIEKAMQFAHLKMRFEFVKTDGNDILIKDNWAVEKKFVTITAEDGGLWCNMHNKEFCIHTGFCWSLYQVYPLAAKK